MKGQEMDNNLMESANGSINPGFCSILLCFKSAELHIWTTTTGKSLMDEHLQNYFT